MFAGISDARAELAGSGCADIMAIGVAACGSDDGDAAGLTSCQRHHLGPRLGRARTTNVQSQPQTSEKSSPS